MRGKALGFKFNGAKLHDLRKTRGLNQRQLAKQMGVDNTLIGKWERGVANPSFENMRELSYLFGIKDDNYWKSDRVATATCAINVEMEEPERSVKELIMSMMDEIGNLKKRVAVLEEQTDMLVRHNNKLKIELKQNQKQDVDWVTIVNALTRMVANKEARYGIC